MYHCHFCREINIKQVLYVVHKVTKKTSESKHSTVTVNIKLHAQKNTPQASVSVVLRLDWSVGVQHGRSSLVTVKVKVLTSSDFRRNGRFRLELELTSFRISRTVSNRTSDIHTEGCRCQCSHFGGIDASARKLGLTIHAARKLFRWSLLSITVTQPCYHHNPIVTLWWQRKCAQLSKITATNCSRPQLSFD